MMARNGDEEKFIFSECPHSTTSLRKLWRYQNEYQKPQIEEGQTMQWPKVKGQKDKQRSRKNYTEN